LPQKRLHISLPAAIILPLLWLMGGCAPLGGGKAGKAETGVDTAPAALVMVADLTRLNQSLASFKGLGRLTLRRRGRILLDERVAWVGSEPDKLGVVVLISGFPAVRIAADGRWIYVDHPAGDPSFRKLPASERTLKQILGISISLREVVTLMGGRVPFEKFRTAELSGQGGGAPNMLNLRQWWGVNQRVGLDPADGAPVWYERLDSSGGLTYRAIFEETIRIDEYRVPSRLSVVTDDDDVFHLAVDRCWVNVPVSDDMFVLTPGR